MPFANRRQALLVAALAALLVGVVALGVANSPRTTGLLTVERADGPVGDAVSFGTLSETRKAQFQRALEADSSVELPLRDAEEWLGTEAVRYDGRTYEVFVAVP